MGKTSYEIKLQSVEVALMFGSHYATDTQVM